MTILIRRLAHKDHEYLAYTSTVCGRGTFFVYFQDNIWGAVVLHNFIEMLRAFYQPSTVSVRIAEQSVTFQDTALLDLLSSEAG